MKQTWACIGLFVCVVLNAAIAVLEIARNRRLRKEMRRMNQSLENYRFVPEHSRRRAIESNG
jgi:hypothetical protein